MKRQFRHVLRAQMRDTRVLLSEARWSLLLFLGLVVGGGALIYVFYVDPTNGSRLGFAEALYAAFALIFMEHMLPFPRQFPLQVLFYVIPIVGLAAVGNAILTTGTALVNKRARGQKWQIAMAMTYRNHVVVCGLGKLGYRTALELIRLGREVVGVEKDPEGRFLDRLRALEVPVIIGDASRADVLIKAGVKQADAIIPATEDELTNLDIALDARELQPDIRVVMRMFDPDFARRVEKGFGIRAALSVSALAAPVFAAAAMRVDALSSFYVGDQLLVLSKFVVQDGSPLAQQSVRELEAQHDVSVVYYSGERVKDLHPAPDRVLGPGDTILILATLDQLARLTELNQPGAS